MAKKTRREMVESLVALRQPEDRKLEVFSELFAPQMAAFEKSPRAKMLGGVSDEDKLVLGECLSNYMMESNNQSNLGLDPLLALSVITSVFGNSVLPLFTSEQPLQDKQGVVYFENVIAKSERGNVHPGDLLNAGARAKTTYPVGYASDNVVVTEVGTVTTKDTAAAIDFNATNLKKGYVVVKLPDGTIGTDDGRGVIFGEGIHGSIDYAAGTGSIIVTKAVPSGGVKVTGSYATDFESNGSAIPTLNVEYDSKIVKAHTYVLQADTSILSSFISNKRLGINANKRAVEILQQQVLREITNEAIKNIATATDFTVGERYTQFDKTAPQGVSIQAHYNSYNLTHAAVQNKMAEVSGKGNFGCMLAGTEFCEFLTGLNEFKQEGTITDDPSYFGTLGGRYGNIKIVRAPQLHILTNNDADKAAAFAVYQNSKVDAAAIFAPFMPVMVTNDVPVTDNLLQRRSIIASMATTEVVVDRYIQKIAVVNA